MNFSLSQLQRFLCSLRYLQKIYHFSVRSLLDFFSEALWSIFVISVTCFYFCMYVAWTFSIFFYRIGGKRAFESPDGKQSVPPMDLQYQRSQSFLCIGSQMIMLILFYTFLLIFFLISFFLILVFLLLFIPRKRGRSRWHKLVNNTIDFNSRRNLIL